MIKVGDILQHPTRDAITFDVATSIEIAFGAWLVKDEDAGVHYVVYPGRGWKMYLNGWAYL